MDFIKKAISSNKASGSSSSAAPADGQKKDYVDKAFDVFAKKSGHKVDDKTAEKITDAGRSMFEKATGKKVDPKISN